MSKADLGYYTVRIVTKVTYPNGFVLDQIIKFPIVIFDKNVGTN